MAPIHILLNPQVYSAWYVCAFNGSWPQNQSHGPSFSQPNSDLSLLPGTSVAKIAYKTTTQKLA